MKNKAILITGVLGNVGSHVAEKFKKEGWMVAGMDRKESTATDAAIDWYIPCDVTDRRAVEQAVAELEKKVSLGAVFTAAGTQLSGDFENTALSDWQNALNVWLGGTINICAATAPYLCQRNEGKIILFSPDYSQIQGDCILNATAVGTVHGFTKSFGLEMAESGVTVNALWANVEFALDPIAAMVFYLAQAAEYITAQVISVTGKE